MSLAKRSVTSAAWNIMVNMAGVVVLIIRSILLARLLPVETFGVYAFASSVVIITAVLPTFGMQDAFLHRAPETRDEKQVAAVHFTLKAILTLLWAAALVVVSMVFTSGEVQTALLLLTVTNFGVHLTQTPTLILTRRVVHRRLALMRLTDAVLSTSVALALAWRGVTLWALLASDIITLLITVFGLYIWRPVWKPRLAWSSSVVRYLLRFGSRSFLADALLKALDRVDDLWTGIFLGETALGFYSRAYRFASYPRFVLALPVNLVAGGTYAELKGDRVRLSRAFFRTNALLVRTGFFMGGLLALIAPEFIRLALGEKWLPMLDAFRLMLVYTLLDPIKITVANVLTTSGSPQKVVGARAVQLAVLIVGLATLGPWLGISGIALAVDAMIVVGMVILFWQARTYVDFSLRRLFGVPAIALAAGLVFALALLALAGIEGSDWLTGAVKLVGFTLVYAATSLLLEREQIPMLAQIISYLRQGDRLARQDEE
jgi:O-antigen/teichoic acid export membrane protein